MACVAFSLIPMTFLGKGFTLGPNASISFLIKIS
jgi:hypothetical protein